jgi:large repetitive protein
VASSDNCSNAATDFCGLAAAAAAQTPAPRVVFLPGTQTEPITGFADPEGIAVDGSGNLYVADAEDDGGPPSYIYKETLSGGAYTQSVVANNFVGAWSVAVDSSGNVYVADFGFPEGGSSDYGAVYKETLSGGSYTESKIGSGFVAPDGIAVDSSGNVYVGDFGCPQCTPVVNGGIYKLTKSGGSYTQTQIGSGLDYVGGVAVDGNGNVYATEWTDYDYTTDVGVSGTVYKETLSGGSYTQSVVSHSFVTPGSVAVDPAGDLYVTDDNNVNGGGIVYKETPSGGGYTQSELITDL